MTNASPDANLIAYCGLYCGDCQGFKGIIPDLARDVRKELRAAGTYQESSNSASFFDGCPMGPAVCIQKSSRELSPS